MRLSPLFALVALAASCGGTTDTTAPCALPVDNLPIRGPSDARVTIVEFSDFQCPFCGMMEPALTQLATDYPSDVRLAYEHLPLAMHDHAYAAAVAAVCAGQQGQFWEMHDVLFAHQNALDTSSLETYASGLALDLATWTTCFHGGAGDVDTGAGTAAAVIRSNESDSERAQISGTPTFFVNGQRAVGAVPYGTLKALVEKEREVAISSAVAPADYYAHVVAKLGCSL